MDRSYELNREDFPLVDRRAVKRLDTRGFDTDLLKASLPLLSPKRLLLLLVVSIFLTEASVMLVLEVFPEMPVSLEALVDAAALVIILSPTFYFFHYRPLLTHYRERKAIVRHLFDSEERLNLALTAVNDGLWDWNVVSGEVYASMRSSTMLGFQPGEIGHRIEDWSDRVHPEDRERVEAQMREHLAGKSDFYRSEMRLRKRNGDYIWVLARGQVVERSRDNWPLRLIGTYTDISPRREAEEALRRSEEDIRNLSRLIMEQSEEEKRHLAQDLHDEFGQVLCAFRLGVEMLRDQETEPRQELARYEGLIKMIDRLEVDLRHMCDHLRPVMLDDLGLVAALKWHLDEFAAQHPEVRTEFLGEGLELYLPQNKEIALYRICQEALNNAGKYAEASRVSVGLTIEERGLCLVIRDNGIGFSEEAIRWRPGGWGLGLLGMRERAAAVGARARIDSAPGRGTLIEVVLPLAAGEENRAEEECV